jgi:uncharacterized protein (TIGR03663 family)
MIALAALGLRCVQLDGRPMHTDEAVHAVVLGTMLEGGTYAYNPHDSHGPTLYYLSWPLLRVAGIHTLAEMEAWQVRTISALVGATTILLLAIWARELGTAAVLIAGVLFTLSAPFVYYQRYFIHEGLFVLMTLVLLKCLSAWFLNRGSMRAAILTGLVSALLFATKETAPLFFLAAALAGFGAWLTEKNRASLAIRAPLTNVLFGLLAFAITFVLFYSSFGSHLAGLSDFLAAQFRFAHRAVGEGHEKPWWTYLAWLFAPNFDTVPWSGWITAALAAIGTLLLWDQLLIRLLFFYTIAIATLYSIIPYKTPWLELNLLAPAILLAGAGASAWWNRAGKFRPALVLLTMLALTGLGIETRHECYLDAIDPRNPLAYSPTVGDVEQLVARVEKIKATSPNDSANIIEVISADYWPLPWYLRKLEPVGYWNDIPPAITGNILITSPDLLPALQAKIGPGWNVDYFGLRPEVLAVVLSKSTTP